MSAQQVLRNFNGLVKNRQGPYLIVMKVHEDYVEWNGNWHLTNEKSKAFEYGKYESKYKMGIGSAASYIVSDRNIAAKNLALSLGDIGFYLTTAAGDIKITIEDFK